MWTEKQNVNKSVCTVRIKVDYIRDQQSNIWIKQKWNSSALTRNTRAHLYMKTAFFFIKKSEIVLQRNGVYAVKRAHNFYEWNFRRQDKLTDWNVEDLEGKHDSAQTKQYDGGFQRLFLGWYWHWKTDE